METLITAITSALVDSINGIFATMGKGLGFAFLVALVSWFGVEHLTPPTWGRRTNTLAALLFGMCLNIGVHRYVSAYGEGMRGVGAAVFYGLLGGLLALPFHHFIAKRFLKPFLASKE